MVAAAKLRRANNALNYARPHAKFLHDSLGRLLQEADAWNHPLIAKKDEPKKAEVWVMTSDRGLCGGFNGNVLRKVEDFLQHDGKLLEDIKLSTFGRKGRDYYKAKHKEVKESLRGLGEGFTFPQAMEMARGWIEKFLNGEWDILYLAYNSFKSAIVQVPVLVQLLPLELSPQEETQDSPLYWEGSPEKIINELLPRYLATQIFLAVLESQASELGSRMSAMENATNNARDMIFNLTLQYNRARQASITTELMDIVNGAEALK